MRINANQVFISSLNSENVNVNLLLWRVVTTVALYRLALSLSQILQVSEFTNGFSRLAGTTDRLKNTSFALRFY